MFLMPTLRLADARTACRYPLPVAREAAWARRDGVCRLRVPLPELGVGTILVPSLAMASPGAGEEASRESVPRHQWTLTAGDGVWALQGIPGGAAPPAPGPGSPVSTHIDCYHVHQSLSGAELQVTVASDRPPGQYLVAVSARPLTIADPALPPHAAGLPHPPTPRSQTNAPEAIASRICSPTCVSMVLDLWERRHDWLGLARECHDPVSDMYGIWPLALAAAARRSCLGAVEVFAGWQEPLDVLAAGIPLITSIRFSAGELPGAPLTDTGGHLVVVYAASERSVLVCDPAAPDGEVLREYAAADFSRAWLRHRGAAYILPP